MVEFLTRFVTSGTVGAVLLFIVVLAIAVKEVIGFIDWAHDRGKKHFDKEDEYKNKISNINQMVTDRNALDEEERTWIDDKFTKIDDEFQKINNTLEMVIDSDKEDIRSFIYDKWNYYCIGQIPIDNYMMECLESRYAIYTKEKGNSFVYGLMEELREWHKKCVGISEV